MSLYVNIEKKLGAFTLQTTFESSSGIQGLLGPSGCGKSYTLKCIAGIEKPDRGQIILDGVTLFDSEKGINLPPQKRQVGYLFQNYALFPHMTVKQNILCGLHQVRNPEEKDRIYRRMLHLLQLEGLENHKPQQLSGGQAQRTALARIMVNQPRLLMLDEPFSALDSHLRLRLQIEMKELLEEIGTDVILVTHSRDEAYRMCRQIAVVSDGKVIINKPTRQLFDDPESKAAASITGCKNIAAARRIGEYEVEVPEWGSVHFRTALPVREDVKAIGIRAHYFDPACMENRMAIRPEKVMEEPFESIVFFRAKEQAEGTSAIWWRVPGDRLPKTLPEEIGVRREDILLLYA